MRVLLATSQFVSVVGGVARLLSQFTTRLPVEVELSVLNVRQQPAGFYVDFDRSKPVKFESLKVVLERWLPT